MIKTYEFWRILRCGESPDRAHFTGCYAIGQWQLLGCQLDARRTVRCFQSYAAVGETGLIPEKFGDTSCELIVARARARVAPQSGCRDQEACAKLFQPPLPTTPTSPFGRRRRRRLPTAAPNLRDSPRQADISVESWPHDYVDLYLN